MDIQQKVVDLRRRLAKVEAEHLKEKAKPLAKAEAEHLKEEAKPPAAAESRLDDLRRRLAEIETELADMEQPAWSDDDDRLMCFGCGEYVEGNGEKHVCYR